MEKRMESGTAAQRRWGREEPRTCTESVPSAVSGKQRAGSCRDVKRVMSCPRRWRETAASTTRRSAPPGAGQLVIVGRVRDGPAEGGGAAA